MAEVVRPGRDVTILCYSRMRYVVMQAVQQLEKQGFDPEARRRSRLCSSAFSVTQHAGVLGLLGRALLRRPPRAQRFLPHPACRGAEPLGAHPTPPLVRRPALRRARPVARGLMLACARSRRGSLLACAPDSAACLSAFRGAPCLPLLRSRR